jgi:3-dehydroquinate synthase
MTLSEIAGCFPRAVKLALVTDTNVDRLHGDRVVREIESSGVRVDRIVFPAGEASKNFETYSRLISSFAALEMTRSDGVVALGGGVVGDLAGFAAATYMRGIGFAQVPTTLLAMVDSSIGGKTGIDIPEGKNLAGAFHLPLAIVRDYSFLETLPEKEMMNGYAEMIKTAILFDPQLFELMKRKPAGDELAEAVERCARLKSEVVDADFKEAGRRMLLNLGHTFGHAFEKISRFSIPHGEAVAMGMRVVSRAVPEVGEILDDYGFSALKPDGFASSREEILSAISHDKKRFGDKVTLVVPAAIGDCRLVETPLEELGKWF